MNIKLSVVIPCYNEESRFQKGLDHYLPYLKKQKYLWELIFVNDGSKDKTLELMQSAQKNNDIRPNLGGSRFPRSGSDDVFSSASSPRTDARDFRGFKNKNIRVVTYKQNHGKGYAIIQGVKEANGNIILFTDIDHSVPIETIEGFYKYFERDFQVVIGSRQVKGANILVHQHPLREFLGRGFTLLVRALVDWKIKDATCGFKAFQNGVAKKIFNKITIYDWTFDAEILFLCKKYKIKVVQAPVEWSDVRGTKVSVGKDILSSLIGLLKIRMNDLQGKYAI
jgi:glycosyltransferase involved in cell wall biosynthesis